MSKIAEVNCMLAVNKPLLDQFFANTSFSLKDRWEVFVKTPDTLKNHDSWIIHFTFPDGTEFECDYDSGYERHMVKSMINIIEGIKEKEAYDEDEDFELDILEDYPDSENVIAFKEYILKNNLGSFTMDW